MTSTSRRSSTSRGRDVPARVIAARNGVAAVFILDGLAMATWFARIPAAKEELGLPAGQLGLVLLAMSSGAVLAMLTAGMFSVRLGTPTMVTVSTGLLTGGLLLAGVGAGLLGSAPLLVMGLFSIGAGAGICDVAMNVEAALVERRLGWTVMPRFHAGWSIGTVTGAGLGSLASRAGLPIEVHLPVVALVVMAGTVLGVRYFLSPGPLTLPVQPSDVPTTTTPSGTGDSPDGASPDGNSPNGNSPNGESKPFGVLAAWTEPHTLLLGLLLLALALTEGTANDWLAVAFVDGHGLDEAGGAAVFGIFVASMTVGRMAGPIALDRWGRAPVLGVTMVLAILGATVVILAGQPVVAVVGAAIWGLGASLGFPVVMSAAADDESRAAARVSVVAVVGYTAFLAGPPLVGLLGDEVGILRALLVVPVLLIPAMVLLPVIRPSSGSDRPGH